MKLTADQEQAKKLIEEWFFNRSDPVFVLAGYAGTGKTFLINHVVKDVLGLKARTEAAFVSPTGKAATVLAQGGTAIKPFLERKPQNARMDETHDRRARYAGIRYWYQRRNLGWLYFLYHGNSHII